MSAQNQVQTLLDAEKEASKIVAKARSYRTQRLKDARAEALKEIEGLKATKNNEFLDYEKKFAGSLGDNVKLAEDDTKAQLEEIKKDVLKNKSAVVARLLSIIGECKPVVHPNVAQAVKKVSASLI